MFIVLISSFGTTLLKLIKILEKFNQMLKNVKQVRPEQVYYLNSSQKKVY